MWDDFNGECWCRLELHPRSLARGPKPDVPPRILCSSESDIPADLDSEESEGGSCILRIAGCGWAAGSRLRFGSKARIWKNIIQPRSQKESTLNWEGKELEFGWFCVCLLWEYFWRIWFIQMEFGLRGVDRNNLGKQLMGTVRKTNTFPWTSNTEDRVPNPVLES